MKMALFLASVATVVTDATPATAADNVVHLEAIGCPNCEVLVTGLIRKGGEWKGGGQSVVLYGGLGTATFPSEFKTIGIEVQDRAKRTGNGSVTTVAFLYRGFQPGDRVSNRQSRNAKWAQDCVTLTEPETWIKFRVKKDRNPKRLAPRSKYSLRAWASPQIAGWGTYKEAYRGRTSIVNSLCGYTD